MNNANSADSLLPNMKGKQKWITWENYEVSEKVIHVWIEEKSAFNSLDCEINAYGQINKLNLCSITHKLSL